MSRRETKSDAEHYAKCLYEILEIVPVWVGPILALLGYLVTAFLIPMIWATPDDPLRATFAAISKTFSPWLTAIVLVIWIFAEIKKFGNRRLLDTRSDLNSLRSLHWEEFERLVGEAFRRKGYTVCETPARPDGGVDLILTKDGKRTFVQCKQWKHRQIGVRPVRELYGVVVAKGAVGGIVVCCGRYTFEARNFVKNQPLELIDGPMLWSIIKEVNRDAIPVESYAGQPLHRPNKASAPASPCPQCNAPMVLRTAKQGAHAGS